MRRPATRNQPRLTLRRPESSANAAPAAVETPGQSQPAAPGAGDQAAADKGELLNVVYRVLHVDAAELRNTLEQTLPKRHAKISVDSRTNNLLVAGSEQEQREIKDLLKKLDQAAPQTSEQSPKILIVPVEHRDAASLVDLIKRMHPKGDNIYADPETNSLIFPNGVEQRYLEILQLLDKPEAKRKTDPASQADSHEGAIDSRPAPISADNKPG